MPVESEPFVRLAVALAIGLLIGIERGWQRRDVGEGQRVAGVRTYSLIGLLGGATGLASHESGLWLAGLVFIGLAISMAAAYVVTTQAGHDVGITSKIAALLTFMLAVLAGLGQIAPAAAAAIVMALLLGYKSRLHDWVSTLRQEELTAGLKLLLISVVLLPILPNQGYGPWEALNPHLIWRMVVLIAAISFFGYIAIRLGGPRRGLIFTGLFGGLASSTATTLEFSRMASRGQAPTPVLAAGILLACGTMLLRMLLVATIIHARLFEVLWLPALTMAVVTYMPVAIYLRQPFVPDADHDQSSGLRNPLELKYALAFGALLAVIMTLGKMLSQWAGDAGLWTLAAASGIADVDAITLSLADMSHTGIGLGVATIGIVIAAAVNSAFKGAMALVVGGPSLGLRVLIPLLFAALTGLALAWMQY